MSVVPVTAHNTAPILRAQNIALGYAHAKAEFNLVLADFSLDLQHGELVALLGPSGVGKSSLLRVLAGLDQPHAGQVELFGQALNRPHARAAFVFQQPSLLPWLTVQENIAFGLSFKNQPQISKSEAHQRVQSAMHEVGLSHAANSYPAALSGGMAQRVALARALARQPEIILLDEPFSALDEVTRGEMQELLRQIVERHHTAAVLVTHDIDEALTVADRVLLLGNKPGRLIGQWSVNTPYPRQDVALTMNALRVDILQTLHRGRLATSDTAVEDYVI